MRAAFTLAAATIAAFPLAELLLKAALNVTLEVAR